MTMSTNVDINFCRIYCLGSLSVHIAVILYVAHFQPSSAEFGLDLIAPHVLACLSVIEIVKIWIAKKVSKHSSVFTLPFFGNAVRGDPTKGPYLRRCVLKLKKLVYWMKPYQSIAKILALFVLGWALVIFFTVCFGAAFFSDHYETAAFSFLLSLMAVLPMVQIFGPDLDRIHKVLFCANIFDTDVIGHVLYQNGFGAVIGAWLGAFPIPLDWDRPWQVWPITCCIGAVVGNFVFNLWSLIQIHSEYRRRAVHTKSRKRT